jgi:hypothetical protein
MNTSPAFSAFLYIYTHTHTVPAAFLSTSELQNGQLRRNDTVVKFITSELLIP